MNMLSLGRFVAGEVPGSVAYTFQDSAGSTITGIATGSGYTVTFRYKRTGASGVSRAAAATAGVATWTPVAADFETAGVYEGEFHATNGTNVYKSERIVWVVYSAVSVA